MYIDSSHTKKTDVDFSEIYTIRKYASSLYDSINNIDQYMGNVVTDMDL